MSIGGLIGAIAGGVIGFFIGGGPIGAFYGASIGFALGMVVDPITPDVAAVGTPLPEDVIMSGEIGIPIPDLAGSAKIMGHLLCFGKERSVAQYTEIEGGKGSDPEPVLTGYKYYMSWAVGILAGPADTLYAVYKNEDIIWDGELDCPASGGQETITLTGMGSATFYFGTDDQVANSKVGEIIGDATLNSPYRNLCWCFFDDCYIGEYPRAPSIKFVLKKIPEYAFSDKHEIQTYDCNAAHAVWYILHDLIGLPESWLHSADFAAIASTLLSESRGLCVLFDKQQNALNYLESINAHIDGILRYGSDAKFHPKLIRDDYTVEDLPTIDEDVMLDEPTLNRKSWIDTINELKVQYSEFYRVEEKIIDGVAWIEKAPTSGTSIDVNSLVVFNDAIYGGAGGIAGSSGQLLKWNGENSWISVAPILNLQHQIHSLVVFNDKIYGGTGTGGRLFEWNGVDAWVQVAPALNSQWRIYDLVVFNNKLYGGTSPGGRLFEWNGIDAWIQVAPKLETAKYIYTLVVFKGKIYGGATGSIVGYLFEWNGTDAWLKVAEGAVGSLVVFNNKLYGGSGGKLMEWNEIDAWVQVAPQYMAEASIRSLAVFNNKLYGGTYPNGKLLEWNEVDAWAEVAPALNSQWSINSLAVFNNKLYGGTSAYAVSGGRLFVWNSEYIPAIVGTDFKNSISDPIAVDTGNYVIQGRIVSKTIQLASFTTNENAVWAANQQLQKESYPFALVEVPVSRNLFRLQVADCFKFSYSKYGISNMICRILQINEENLESEDLTIHAMEDIFGISNAITVYTDPTDYTPEVEGYDLTPFTHQAILEAPFVLSAGDIKVVPLACRETDLDLGFDVYLSIDGGSSYLLIGRIPELKPFGTLVGTYSEDTYTIDEADGFTIDFVKDASLIDTVTWSSVLAAQINNAILGDELITFQTITPVAGTQYKLEGVIRGRFGTQKIAHVADEEFWFLGENISSIAHPEILAGADRKFKFVPYNVKYSGDISESTVIDLSIEGDAKKPYISVNFLANGSSFAARYSADIVLTWSPRYRGKGAGIGTPGIALADADREGYFEVEVWVSGSKVRTTTAIDAATWTYTTVMNNADNGALASEVLFKLLNYRTEDGVLYESDQVEVTCKKS